MTYTVIENIKIRTSKGDYTLSPGQRIELSEDAADKLLKSGKIRAELPTVNPIWKNTYPEVSPEAERATLQEVMGDMVQAACQQIIEDYKARGIASYKSTPENQWAEMEITRIYNAVLDGRADIDDFKQACENWLNPISSFKAISKITGGGNDAK